MQTSILIWWIFVSCFWYICVYGKLRISQYDPYEQNDKDIVSYMYPHFFFFNEGLGYSPLTSETVKITVVFHRNEIHGYSPWKKLRFWYGWLFGLGNRHVESTQLCTSWWHSMIIERSIMYNIWGGRWLTLNLLY